MRSNYSGSCEKRMGGRISDESVESYGWGCIGGQCNQPDSIPKDKQDNSTGASEGAEGRVAVLIRAKNGCSLFNTFHVMLCLVTTSHHHLPSNHGNWHAAGVRADLPLSSLLFMGNSLPT